MVALVITEANVAFVSGDKETRNAAETITAGDCLYTASTLTVGVATNADVAKDHVIGIALNAATTGQPCTYAKSGSVVGFGAILAVGKFYQLGAAGAIDPVADGASNDYVSLIGYGDTTSNMKVQIVNTGRQIA